MVSQVINVIVNSKGMVTVQKQLSNIGDTARQTTTYLNGLRAILSAALTFTGASSIIETIDNFTTLQNRLRQVAEETTVVADSWSRLLDIANNSYSTIDNTVNLYFRVAQAYKAWGESMENAYEFTDLFNKAAVLSGSTMQTTAQAVYQFSQALNKGKLDGDEFRSVLEGLPYVANVIQKSLGVTRAQLYQMSRDGEISVDKIKVAFENAAEAIRGDFAKITPTIGMALIVLKNNWVDFVGRIQNSTGVFSLLARTILLLANNFDLLAIALTPVAASLAFLGGRLVLGLIVTGFKDMALVISRLIPMFASLNVVLAAGPFGWIAAAIAAAVAGIIYFRNELGLTNENLAVFANVAVTTFNTVVEFFRNGINNIVQFFGQMYNSVSNQIVRMATYLRTQVGPVFTEISQLAKEFYSLIMEIADFVGGLLVESIQAILPAFEAVWDYAGPTLSQMLNYVGDIYDGWVLIGNFLKNNFLKIIQDAFEGWIIIIRKVIGFIRDLIQALRTALNLMRSVLGSNNAATTTTGGAHYGAQFYAGEFATGGRFKVGGTGAGRDTTPVAFRAERGERVTVETKKQQRQADNMNQDVKVNVPVGITNVFDPNMMVEANMSSKGQRSIVNVITANRDEINAILGVG